MNADHPVRRAGRVCLFLFAAMGFAACGGNSDDVPVSDTRTDGSDLTSEDKEAAEFVRSKLAEVYVKGPDGWTAQLQQYNVLGELMHDRVPVVLYRQYRQLEFSISPKPLSEAQKLNGADYRAEAIFKDSPVRQYQTEATFEAPQGWGNWKDTSLAFSGLAIERRNGQWLISDSDILFGVRPDPGAVPSG